MADADELAAALEGIREREQAATPGPWAWRGNTDNGDPYLTSLGRREHKRPDGTTTTFHAGDVLSHVSHELTRAEAVRYVNTDLLPEPKIDLEPEGTFGERYQAALDAAEDEAITDLLTDENGEPRKEARLAFCTDYVLHEARGLAVFEVAPGVTDREDPRVYRADITGIRHPDAEFIAHAREDLARLLSAVEAVLADHREDSMDPGWCACCGFGWPCVTVQAITTALTGEAAPDGKGGDGGR